MDVRPYAPADRPGCLEVYDSNSPGLLSPDQRADFDDFLHHLASPYFVLQHEDAIAACGGYRLLDHQTALLQWGMVRRPWQRQGLGRLLLLYRLREIGKVGGVEFVQLDSPPHAAPFFASQGFKATRVTAEIVQMRMRLAVCH